MTEEDFLFFIRNTAKALTKKAYARVGDHADDVLQETILYYCEHGEDGLPRYTGYPSWPNRMFHSELRKTFNRRLANYVRDRKKGAWMDQAPLFECDMGIELQEGPDVAYEQMDELKHIPFWELTDKELYALDLYFGHGLDTAQIGEALGIAKNVARVRVNTALAKLRESVCSELAHVCAPSDEPLRKLQERLVEELWQERGSQEGVLLALLERLVQYRKAGTTAHLFLDEEIGTPDLQTDEP